VIVGVIIGHAWAGYDAVGGWAYSNAREVSIAPLTRVLAEAILGPFGLFAMGLLFLVSGMLLPASIHRKGPGRFARDRLLRLGVPLLVFTFVLWPPVRAYLDRLAHRPVAPWWVPDPAHLWFVEVLLLFSLSYAAWRRWVPDRPTGSAPLVLTLGGLAGLAAAVAAASFLVRFRFPLGSSQVADLHLSQWPQFLALFGLGVNAARHGWLDPVPERLRRQCGVTALIGVVAVGGFAVVAAVAGVPTEAFLGGRHWAALATAAAEGLLAATVPIWLLGIAQRHLEQWRGADLAARSAYAAFLLQGHVLVALALALRPVIVAAEVKAGLVAILSVGLCLGIGRLLVQHTILGRIL